MRFLLSLLFAIALYPSFAQTPLRDEAAIRTLLATQVSEWNRGSIAGYMHGYWEDDSLLFIGKNGPTYGYRETLERYLKAYPDAAHMGQLTSALLSLQQLSPEYYFAVGKWALKRDAATGDLSGSWTLLFRKVKGVWVIICDHSS